MSDSSNAHLCLMPAVAGNSMLKYNPKSALQHHLIYLLHCTVSKCLHSKGDEHT